ncbi:hypothetical protein Athai_40180 [Actinocatenispora thailandica]|uniref:Uncharacterized protein n=1 Tax=Actinocatenispora thailandica TaxID=227318 RepID=A0A7R7DRX9_9ACTN|nr:hypothetical protein Athai_40180 [Actinocatenispora thailandica]
MPGDSDSSSTTFCGVRLLVVAYGVFMFVSGFIVLIGTAAGRTGIDIGRVGRLACRQRLAW